MHNQPSDDDFNSFLGVFKWTIFEILTDKNLNLKKGAKSEKKTQKLKLKHMF